MPSETEAEEAPVELHKILFPSPIGVIGIELAGEVLTRIALVPKGRDRASFRPFADLKKGERSAHLDEVVGRFSEFLAGARKKIDIPTDLSRWNLDAFSRRVLKETAKVPYGRTRTYQQIATATGRPSAYRQVLAVLQTNPLPLVIPCHRVVTTKSGPGSYVAGTSKKSWLLKMERRGLTV